MSRRGCFGGEHLLAAALGFYLLIANSALPGSSTDGNRPLTSAIDAEAAHPTFSRSEESWHDIGFEPTSRRPLSRGIAATPSSSNSTNSPAFSLAWGAATSTCDCKGLEITPIDCRNSASADPHYIYRPPARLPANENGWFPGRLRRPKGSRNRQRWKTRPRAAFWTRWA